MEHFPQASGWSSGGWPGQLKGPQNEHEESGRITRNLEAAVYFHELASARTVRGGDNPSAKEVQSTVLGVCDSRTNSTARRGRGRTGKVDSGTRRHAEGDAYLHGPALVNQHEAPRRRSYRFRRPRASSFPLVVGLEPPASVPVVMAPVDPVPPGEA